MENDPIPTVDHTRVKYVPFANLSPQERNFSYASGEEPRKVFIADRDNHCIRILDVNKADIQTYAGVCGTAGFKDGALGQNLLSSPDLVGVDAEGYLFIFDSGNKYIRMVNREGEMVTLIQGACKEDFNTIPPKIPF